MIAFPATNHERLLAIVREFVADVEAAFGSEGQSDEEIQETLANEWPDLAVTYSKAATLLDAINGEEG